MRNGVGFSWCFLFNRCGSCGGWQGDPESAAGTKVTLGFDRSAVGFADGFANGKTEAASANFSRARLVDPIKPIKKPLNLAFRNARSVVFHFEHAAGISRRQPDVNP